MIDFNKDDLILFLNEKEDLMNKWLIDEGKIIMIAKRFAFNNIIINYYIEIFNEDNIIIKAFIKKAICVSNW